MQRRLAAILHADIVGYSRRMAEDELGALAELKARLELLAEAITSNGGRICNTAGDAVLAEFASVNAAIGCAVNAQRRIAALNGQRPESERLALRIGINLGEVMAEDDGQVYGTGVNVAARLQALADPGGIAVSGRAREQVARDLGVSFAPMGTHRVKNIPTPINVFRVVDGGLPATRPSRPPSARRRFRGAGALILAGVLVLAVAGVALWSRGHLPHRPPRADGGRVAIETVSLENRVAVLPFRNASGDPRQDYFAEAITEDLSGALSRFAEIGVIASEAIATLGDSPAAPQDLRRRFGVAYLLTGSVRQDGDTVRLNARLVDTRSGLHLWSNTYDRPLGELFEVQDDIVRTVAGETMVTLGRIERARVFGQPMPDLKAYDLFIRGRAHLVRETRDDNVLARTLFRQALDRDPRFALAHVGLGWTHYREATRGWSQFMTRNISEAERSARDALRLDADLPEAHELLGMVLLLGGKHEAAEEMLRRAVALNPNNVGALQELGVALVYLGSPEDAVRAIEKALSLGASPNSRSIASLAIAHIFIGDARQAVRVLESHTHNRRDHFYYAALTAAYIGLGERDKAVAAAEATRRAWPFFKVESFAQQFHDPDHARHMRDALRDAGLS